MKKYLFLPLLTCFFLAGCATQRAPVSENRNEHTLQAQKAAQLSSVVSTPTSPRLKRKIAVGRVSNETLFGRSLLVDDHNDRIGKQLSDMLSSRLIESGDYVVMEYPDLERLQDLNTSSKRSFSFRGVDTFIVGSLTKFGRKTIGESGFLSSTKHQVAFAEISLRLIDASTGQSYQSITGSGTAKIESGQVAGFGSKAGYDGTLNDKAIGNAIADATDKMSRHVLQRPWFSTILKIRNNGKEIIISGGKFQGLKPGMILNVLKNGERIRSEQTGFDIQLPGEVVASIKVVKSFGKSDIQEASIAKVISGNLSNYSANDLRITLKESQQ